MPFSTGMGLNFYIFLDTWKKSKKSYIYIYTQPETARPRDDQTNRKMTSHRPTTLQAGLINQIDNDGF